MCDGDCDQTALEVHPYAPEMVQDGVDQDCDGVTMDDKVGELGDIFWYLARLIDTYGLRHQDVLHANFVKLVDRKNRGVLKGDGDNR